MHGDGKRTRESDSTDCKGVVEFIKYFAKSNLSCCGGVHTVHSGVSR